MLTNQRDQARLPDLRDCLVSADLILEAFQARVESQPSWLRGGKVGLPPLTRITAMLKWLKEN